MATAAIEIPKGWTAFAAELRRDHLDVGRPRSCKWCPVALAISEAVGAWRFVDVSVDGRVIVKHPSGRHVEAIVEDPEELARIVRLIDDGGASAVCETTIRLWCPFPPLEEL